MEGIAPEISDEGVQRLLSTQEDGAQEAEHLS